MYDTENKYCPVADRFNPPCESCMWAFAQIDNKLTCSIMLMGLYSADNTSVSGHLTSAPKKTKGNK